MATSIKIKPPAGLSLPARLFWMRIRSEYEIADSGGLAILEQAAKCFDMIRVCEETIKKRGMTFTDRFSQPRQAPWVLNLRDARNQLLKCLRQLNLDIERDQE